MPAPKTLADWKPLPAERRLAEEMASGQTVVIGDGTVPPENLPDTDPRVIRTSFLRALILGKIESHPPHEKGVRVRGAFVRADGPPRATNGGLDLESCDIPGSLILLNCFIPDRVELQDARLRNLILVGSHLGDGLSAQGLDAWGSVSMWSARVFGEVSLDRARLGGDLICVDAQLLTRPVRHALSANHIEVKGSVNLAGLTADGAVLFQNAKLGGDLNCQDIEIKAATDITALNCEGAQIAGILYLRYIRKIEGIIDLGSAQVGTIADDFDSWPSRNGDLVLNGLVYRAFVGASPNSAKARLKWLSLQDPARSGDAFWPQPYDQLATYFEAARRNRDATAVRYERARLERRAEDRRKAMLRRWLSFALHGAHDAINGFGYKPFRAFWLLVIFFVAGIPIYHGAWSEGAFRPTSPVILRSVEWNRCAFGVDERRYLVSVDGIRSGRAQRVNGELEPQLSCYLREQDITGMSGWDLAFYSLDTVVPTSVLALQDSWTPNEEAGAVGKWTRYFQWGQILAGWGLSFFAIVGFARLRGG